MNIALCYCAKDRAEAERLASWLLELGPFPRHSFLIFRHADCEPIPAFEQFAAGEWIINDDVFNSWPQSANHAFKKVGKHVEYTSGKPFLWIEPDAVPLHGKAFDQIEDEYNRLGKPFLGDIVNDGAGFVPHMSGIGVYPGSISNFAGEIYFAGSEPWDIFAAAQILPQAARSEYIFHRWKAPPIESLAQLNANVLSVRPKCALFHSDKSGNLIALLRGHALPVPDAPPPSTKPEPPPPDLPMDVSGKIQPLPAPAVTPPSIYEAGIQRVQIPWADKEESKAEIRALVARLAEFCVDKKLKGKEGARTRAVRIALHEAKIIRLPYRPKNKLKKPHWGERRGHGPRPPGYKTREQIRAEKRAAKLEAENEGN